MRREYRSLCGIVRKIPSISEPKGATMLANELYSIIGCPKQTRGKTMKTIHRIALSALACTSSAIAGFSLTGNVNSGQTVLTWPSQVNHEYTIMLSTNLAEGYTESATVQATPPLNSWWEDIGHAAGFYAVQRPLATNTPPPSSMEIDQIKNGGFSSGLDDWLKGTASTGDATFSESGGEAFIDIADGGTAQWHVFLRQTDLVFSNGTTYTVRFDARAVAARDIQVIFQGDNGSGTNLKSIPVSIDTGMATYEVSHAMTSDPTQIVRLHFGLGNDSNNVWIDNVKLVNTVTSGNAAGNRDVAHEINRRMGRGNNFMAAKSMSADGAPEDYALLNGHYFTHCRIGYKMDEICGAAPTYAIPTSHLDELQGMVDWCLAEGLIAIVDPVHNWANNGDPAQEYDPDDLPKLSNIWVQVATRFANHDPENVVFEIMNEPHSEDNVADVIDTGLAAIRSVAGNEERIVIASGDGFSTRQALIDAFDNDEIPANDMYLIGTFHYYDPRPFTAQGAGSVNWGTSTEFAQTITDFAAVLTANTNWAVRNGTTPLPIYLGEFGVDNGAPAADRKKWLSWIRMQAEAHGMSWAHWNMYNNTDTAKGMGPWTTTEKNNPEMRYFDTDPVEALVGRYEFENGTKGGETAFSSDYAGYTGMGYTSFSTNSGVGTWARAENIYIPTNGTYAVKIHYASVADRDLRLVSRNDTTTVQTLDNVHFPATGGLNSWKTLEVEVYFEVGELGNLKVVATPDPGVSLDWLQIRK